jgi:hypothetical protein
VYTCYSASGFSCFFSVRTSKNLNCITTASFQIFSSFPFTDLPAIPYYLLQVKPFSKTTAFIVKSIIVSHDLVLCSVVQILGFRKKILFPSSGLLSYTEGESSTFLLSVGIFSPKRKTSIPGKDKTSSHHREKLKFYIISGCSCKKTEKAEMKRGCEVSRMNKIRAILNPYERDNCRHLHLKIL